MTIINTSPDRIIQLGYEGEDRVTVLRFRYGKDWLENGEGVFHIRIRRHGEHTAYNAQLVADDAENNCLLMTVTNVELSVKGTGEMQVVYSGENFVKKSPIYSYNVSRAVDEVADPPAQDVYTQIIESLSDLQTDVQGLSDAVEDIGDISLLTTMAKTDLVSAINEVNAKGGADITVDDALSTTSENPVQNKVVTSAVQGKADIQTVSALSDAVQGLDGDVQGLQTAVQSKVGDVQIDGTSIVTDGVAEIPIADINRAGVVKVNSDRGISMVLGTTLQIVSAPSSLIKQGTSTFTPVSPKLQHESTFYGLAKAAGDTTQAASSNAVGQYTEEAKTAIRTMLGIGTARELREYSELGEDTDLIEIPLPEKYEKVWYRFQCRINNADNNLPDGLTQYVAWLGDSSSFGSNEQNISIYNNVYIRTSDIFMIKGFFIVDFPLVERFSSEVYGATNWSAKSNLVTYDGAYMSMNRLTSYPRSLFIRPYETNKGYLFKANSKLGVYVK